MVSQLWNNRYSSEAKIMENHGKSTCLTAHFMMEQAKGLLTDCNLKLNETYIIYIYIHRKLMRSIRQPKAHPKNNKTIKNESSPAGVPRDRWNIDLYIYIYKKYCTWNSQIIPAWKLWKYTLSQIFFQIVNSSIPGTSKNDQTIHPSGTTGHLWLWKSLPGHRRDGLWISLWTKGRASNCATLELQW